MLLFFLSLYLNKLLLQPFAVNRGVYISSFGSEIKCWVYVFSTLWLTVLNVLCVFIFWIKCGVKPPHTGPPYLRETWWWRGKRVGYTRGNLGKEILILNHVQSKLSLSGMLVLTQEIIRVPYFSTWDCYT